MLYPTLPGRQFSYDVGGGSVYYAYSVNGTLTPLTTAQMTTLNSTNNKTPVLSRESFNEETSTEPAYLTMSSPAMTP